MPLVILTEEAKQDVEKLPVVIQARVDEIVKRLELWPDVSGAKPLGKDLAGLARIRTGDYRVVFRIPKPGQEVVIVKVDNRRDVYGSKRSARSPEPGPVEATSFIASSIASNIRMARFDAGLTQAALAERLGVGQTMVAGAEAGRIAIGERYVVAVLKACGQPADYPHHRRVRTARRAASPRRRR